MAVVFKVEGVKALNTLAEQKETVIVGFGSILVDARCLRALASLCVLMGYLKPTILPFKLSVLRITKASQVCFVGRLNMTDQLSKYGRQALSLTPFDRYQLAKKQAKISWIRD